MKIKELLKIKTLKRISEEELKKEILLLKNGNLFRAIDFILSSGMFDIKCDFLTIVGSRTNKDKKFETNSLYDFLVVEKGLTPVTFGDNGLTLYVISYSGYLKKIKPYNRKKKFIADNGLGYNLIYAISMEKKV